METYKIETFAGDSFDRVAKSAQETSKTLNQVVEFDFNGVKCLVDEGTNLELFFRDYLNALKMGWEYIFPDTVEDLSPDILAQIAAKDKDIEERRAQWRKEAEETDAREKREFEEKVSGVVLSLRDADGWQQCVNANQDGYGKAVIDFAESWARLMQAEISKGKTVAECYEYTQNGLGFFGITGFQFGGAVSILCQTWTYGEELRKRHYKQ